MKPFAEKTPEQFVERLSSIDMTVPHYTETKDFLDGKARETMTFLRDLSNNVLRFKGEVNG